MLSFACPFASLTACPHFARAPRLRSHRCGATLKMALDFRAEAVSHAFGTVSFFMADDDRTIRVDVPKDLRLASVGSATPVSKYGYEDRLMRCRKIFDQIATR